MPSPRAHATLAVVAALTSSPAVAVAQSAAPAPAATPAPAAHPKPLAQTLTPEAKGDYDAGKILFEDGDFPTSRIKFQAAYDLSHDARLLWNVAVCQKNERHYAKALATLAKYLAEGGSLLTAGDRKDAQDLSKAITPFTSAATFRVSEDGAELWVDDAHVGTTPIAKPFAVDLGPRKVRARKEGFRVFEKEVEVGGNATVTIDVTMERQSGRLDLRVPTSAAVSIDGKEIGKGPAVSADLPVGGHELLVTAPGMRPYQGDLVIEDGRTRAFDVTLERAPEVTSEARVAVGCGRPEPGTPEDGLAVFIDDAKESAPALGTRRHSERSEHGREGVAYVPYAVPPGKHTLHVALAGCDAQDTSIDAPAGGHATIEGMLPPAHLAFNASPADSPDDWRVSAGFTSMSQTFSGYDHFFQPPPGETVTMNPVNMTLLGASVRGGLQGRWAELLGELRIVRGGTSDATPAVGVTPSAGPTDTASSLTILSAGVRPGARLPLFFGALSAGVGFDLGFYVFSPSTLGTSRTAAYDDGLFWAAADVKPFCNWGLQAGIAYTATTYVNGNASESAATSTWVHVVYEPNVTCDRVHAGEFKIVGTTQ